MNKQSKPIPVEARDVTAPEKLAPRSETGPDYVLDLRFLFKAMLRHSWIIFVFAAVGIYMGYEDAKNFQPKHVATMIVLPQAGGMGGISVGNSSQSGVAGVAANLGLSFVGGSASSDQFERLKLSIGSVRLAQRLDEKYGLLREVFASRWDEAAGDWKPPPKTEQSFWQRIMARLHQNHSLGPGIEALSYYAKGSLQFELIDGTNFWQVSSEHADKETAYKNLTRTYWTADELLREQDRVKVNQRREYLQRRLASAQLTDLRQGLLAAMMAEERSAQLLEGDLPYAAEIIEPPFVSDRKTKPNLIKLIGVPTVTAVMIGCFLVVFLAVFRRE